MTVASRKQGVLASLLEHEEMMILLNCLTRSPMTASNDEEEDEDETLIKHDLKDRGLIEVRQDGWLDTTKAGREALINYINGQ